MKIRPVGRTDRRTDMTRLMVGFCNFENKPKQPNFLLHSCPIQPIYFISVNSVSLYDTLKISYCRPIVSTGKGLQKTAIVAYLGCYPNIFRNRLWNTMETLLCSATPVEIWTQIQAPKSYRYVKFSAISTRNLRYMTTVSTTGSKFVILNSQGIFCKQCVGIFTTLKIASLKKTSRCVDGQFLSDVPPSNFRA